MRLELGVEVEVGVAEAVHPEHPAEVVAVQRHEAGDREHAHQKDDREHEDRDGEEGRTEMVGLGDQSQGDHGAGEDGQKHVHAPQRLLVRQGAGRQQAPVLGGQDLQRSRLDWTRRNFR